MDTREELFPHPEAGELRLTAKRVGDRVLVKLIGYGSKLVWDARSSWEGPKQAVVEVFPKERRVVACEYALAEARRAGDEMYLSAVIYDKGMRDSEFALKLLKRIEEIAFEELGEAKEVRFVAAAGSPSESVLRELGYVRRGLFYSKRVGGE